MEETPAIRASGARPSGVRPSGMRPSGVQLSVVMPAHNEEPYLDASVTGVVDGLAGRFAAPGAFEVIIVENGSTDHTIDVAKKLADCHGMVRVLSRPEADYGRALRDGFLAATGELVVNFDVDYVDLRFLDAALDAVGGADAAGADAAGADASGTPDAGASGVADAGAGAPVIVVGSKRGPGSDDHRSVGRRAVTAVFSAVLRHGFGLKVSDTHGVKLLRREPLVPLVEASRFGGSIFDTELVLRAERAGWPVAELPVTVTDQRPPRTSIVQRIPRTLLGLARLRLMLWRERRRG